MRLSIPEGLPEDQAVGSAIVELDETELSVLDDSLLRTSLVNLGSRYDVTRPDDGMLMTDSIRAITRRLGGTIGNAHEALLAAKPAEGNKYIASWTAARCQAVGTMLTFASTAERMEERRSVVGVPSTPLLRAIDDIDPRTRLRGLLSSAEFACTLPPAQAAARLALAQTEFDSAEARRAYVSG